MIIGPADIRFELWFNDQKLSRDDSIKVEWLPAQPPVGSDWARPAGDQVIEMSTTPPTPVAPVMNPFKDLPNGKNSKMGIAIMSKTTMTGNDETMKARFGGLFAKARSGIWSSR